MPASAANRGKPETMVEMATSLLKLEGEKIEVVSNTDAGKARVISDEDLNMLLDRSPEVFSHRGKGWASKGGEQKDTAAFKVYEAPVDEGNDALARMMGEDMEC
jgi:ATP-dependent DNA helicase